MLNKNENGFHQHTSYHLFLAKVLVLETWGLRRASYFFLKNAPSLLCQQWSAFTRPPSSPPGPDLILAPYYYVGNPLDKKWSFLLGGVKANKLANTIKNNVASSTRKRFVTRTHCSAEIAYSSILVSMHQIATLHLLQRQK